MIRKGIVKVVRKSAAVVLVLALSAGLWGCGGSKEEEQAAVQQEAAAEESASAQSTVQEPINPEEVKSEDIIKEEEQPAAAATQKEPEKDVIEKPEPSEENTQEQEKKEEKEEKKDGKAAVDLNEVLDGHMTFDGMDLQFPIEVSGMKLGKWTLTYQIDTDPSEKTLAHEEVVLAKMTSPDYTDNDVIVMAEFGNYTGSEAQLSDLPMTGIYITKGKGTDTAEAKTPALELPCGFTWGTSEGEIREQLGEASLSGSFEYEFDFMYENGQYMIELAGMGDSGLEYVVYSVE